jgi:hypothetical protein
MDNLKKMSTVFIVLIFFKFDLIQEIIYISLEL